MSDTDFLDKLQSLQTPVSDQTYITVHIINIFMALLEGKTNVHTLNLQPAGDCDFYKFLKITKMWTQIYCESFT